MKNSYLLIIFILLFVGHKTRGENVSKKIHFSYSLLKIDTITGVDGETYVKMSYPETVTEGTLGFPTLPVKLVTIPLPYPADSISLNILSSNTISYSLSRKIFPVQEPVATSLEKTEEIFFPCDNRIYASTSYPTEQARIVEISCAEYGKRNVVVAVYPAVYHPSENRCDFSEDIVITLSYNNSRQRTLSQTRNSQTRDIGIPFYEYCVITSQNLKNAFDRLIAWKREKGLNAGVVCIEDILNDTNIVGDTVSSIYDNAGKIRQYLQYAYESGVTRYVLFGGNNQILPIRYGTGDKYNANSLVPEDYHIPTDLYFSELNSNWNIDNDIHYGEPIGVWDYGSELSVGRILCTNTEEINNYTNKLLRYELNPGNGDFSYLKKALYTQADHIQDYREAEYVSSYLHNIFPIDTIFSEKPSCYAPLPTAPYGNDVIAEMSRHYGYVSWGGHGHPNGISVKSNGDSRSPIYAITSVQGNIPYVMTESANGLNNLMNKDYPMFAYSISCFITPFDIYKEYTEFPNIGQSFTLGKDYGGPVLVGNTRKGWSSNTAYLSSELQKLFNDYMWDYTIGESEILSKQYYAGLKKHYLSLSSNVIGCPNIRVWTDIPSLFSATISYDSDNCFVTSNSFITDAEIGIRYITQFNDSSSTVTFNPSQGTAILTNSENCMITLTGKNCLPQIMPLTIQNATLQGTHYAIIKDVTCGKNVRNGIQGDVTFEENADYTFETKGTFKLSKGVKIKKGARLKVVPSEINY